MICHDKNSNNEIKNRGGLFVWGFVLIVMLLAAIHGDAKAENISQNKTIQSVTFEEGWDIKKVLQYLAARYQKNIVPSPKVDGQLAFTTLSNVTFEEVMDAILGESFKYMQKGNLIKVYTAEEYKKIKEDKNRMITRVFTLYYISAAEVTKLIEPVLSGSGSIRGSSPAKTVVPTGESISEGTGGGDTMALNDTIVILDYPENIAEAEKLLKELDVRPQQVLIEATIFSATLTEDMQFGIDWQTLRGTMTNLGDITRDAPDYFTSAGTSAVTKTGGLTVGVTSDDIAAFIRAVEEVTDITIMANPKILAVNKQLGQVYIGKKLGYREGDIETPGGGVQEGAVKFLDTGTKLSFRPYIGNDGYIRMDIHPKDSSGSLNAQGVPSEDSTEVATNIMVKDGQTVVIGGLFRDKVTTTRTQIPVLGDIPILGAVFRGTTDKVERQEVMVLLTPHIINEPKETLGDARAEDIARKRNGAKDELQWINRARLAEDRYAKAAKYYIEGKAKAALWEVNSALELRPTYLEAIRLKERIIGEMDPEKAAKMERNVLDVVEQEDSDKWIRR